MSEADELDSRRADRARRRELLRPGDQRLPVRRLPHAARRGAGLVRRAPPGLRRHPLRRRPRGAHGHRAFRQLAFGQQARPHHLAARSSRSTRRRAGCRRRRSPAATTPITARCAPCSTTPSARSASRSSNRSSARSPTSSSTAFIDDGTLRLGQPVRRAAAADRHRHADGRRPRGHLAHQGLDRRVGAAPRDDADRGGGRLVDGDGDRGPALLPADLRAAPRRARRHPAVATSSTRRSRSGAAASPTRSCTPR